MNVVVTGGGGFLGSAIVRRLAARGDVVTVVARGNYPGLPARVLRVDLCDAEATRAAFEGQDLCVHVAAKTGVWGPRADFWAANVVGTENVLSACRAQGVRRLVHTSSPSAIFDGLDHHNAGNDLPYPGRYEAFYPETKAESERLVRAANGPELATVCLRPHLIYGPGDPWLLPRIIARHRAGKLRIVGDGQNEVSLTWVQNAAAAHLQAADQLRPGVPWAGQAYFVNDPAPVKVWAWLNTIFAGIGLPPLTRSISYPMARAAGTLAEATWRLFRLAGEPPMTRFVAAQLARSHTYDLAPAVAAFGYTPVAPDGLDETIRFFAAHQESGPGYSVGSAS